MPECAERLAFRRYRRSDAERTSPPGDADPEFSLRLSFKLSKVIAQPTIKCMHGRNTSAPQQDEAGARDAGGQAARIGAQGVGQGLAVRAGRCRSGCSAGAETLESRGEQALEVRAEAARGDTRRGQGARSAKRSRRNAAAPGQREQDVARLVGERPGITVAELARQLSVDATGLYAVVRRLQAEGQITKEGTALRPITATPEPLSATRPEPAAAASTPHSPAEPPPTGA